MATVVGALSLLLVVGGLAAPAYAVNGGVRNVSANRCIDVSGGDTTDGRQLILYDCNGGNNQQVTPTSSRELRILGRCIDAASGGTTDGAAAVIYACNGQSNQKWTVGSDGSIRSDAGRCLEAPGGRTANGTLLQVWACNGGANQRWADIAATGGGGSTGTLNAKFRGVNWADPGDNFQADNIVPNGLVEGESTSSSYNSARRVLQAFQTNFRSNTVRMAINPYTVRNSWWNNYRQAVQAANDLGMNVILGNWGPQSSQFAIPDVNAWYTMWDSVISQYRGNSRISFEPFNEPLNQADWVTLAANWVARYPQVDRSRMFIDGTGLAENAYPIGSDARFSGTVISIHVYSLFGRSHTTYNDWRSDFSNSLSSYSSRIVVTEFGVPTVTGVNYNGARDGTNDRSYLWAVTDLIRERNLGAVYFEGVDADDPLTLLRANAGYTSFTVVNRSVVDRLNNAWRL